MVSVSLAFVSGLIERARDVTAPAFEHAQLGLSSTNMRVNFCSYWKFEGWVTVIGSKLLCKE